MKSPSPTVRNIKVELADFDDIGVRSSFSVRPLAMVQCDSCLSVVPAADMKILEMRRVEGQSDPADMAVVVALWCPSCHRAGSIVLTYGPEAAADDADVLADLADDVWRQTHAQ